MASGETFLEHAQRHLKAGQIQQAMAVMAQWLDATSRRVVALEAGVAACGAKSKAKAKV